MVAWGSGVAWMSRAKGQIGLDGATCPCLSSASCSLTAALQDGDAQKVLDHLVLNSELEAPPSPLHKTLADCFSMAKDFVANKVRDRRLPWLAFVCVRLDIA